MNRQNLGLAASTAANQSLDTHTHGSSAKQEPEPRVVFYDGCLLKCAVDTEDSTSTPRTKTEQQQQVDKGAVNEVAVFDGEASQQSALPASSPKKELDDEYIDDSEFFSVETRRNNY